MPGEYTISSGLRVADYEIIIAEIGIAVLADQMIE